MSMRVRYLITTLGLLAVASGIVFVQAWPQRVSSLPRIRAAGTSPRSMPAAPPVSARQLLDQGSRAGLTSAQRARLDTLDREWQRVRESVEAAIRTETAVFAEFMSQARATPGTSLGELERRSTPLRELSATLREGRRRQGMAAEAVLTESQRQRLTTMTAAERDGGRP